jgi:4-diphosphocytidyl-2C-methyl-D-erythritol kinase
MRKIFFEKTPLKLALHKALPFGEGLGGASKT